MAKRFTDTELWDKEWFMALPARLKCLVKMVRDKADLSGVWHPNWTLAKNYVGEKVTEKELLMIDGGNQFVKTAAGKIYCVGFIEFQYGELSPKSPVHRKVIGILDTHKIDYKHPINRVQEEEEDKEEEKAKDTDKEKEEDGGEKKVDAKPVSVHTQCKDFYIETQTLHNRECNWSGRYASDLKHILEKLTSSFTKNKGKPPNDLELVESFKFLITKLPAWYEDKSLSIINSSYDSIVNTLKNGSKSTAGKSDFRAAKSQAISNHNEDQLRRVLSGDL